MASSVDMVVFSNVADQLGPVKGRADITCKTGFCSKLFQTKTQNTSTAEYHNYSYTKIHQGLESVGSSTAISSALGE
jgi:hypothetical protein